MISPPFSSLHDRPLLHLQTGRLKYSRIRQVLFFPITRGDPRLSRVILLRSLVLFVSGLSTIFEVFSQVLPIGVVLPSSSANARCFNPLAHVLVYFLLPEASAVWFLGFGVSIEMPN